MPQTYDSDDCRLEMEAELATARDDLAAEIKAHKRTVKSLAWYRDRVDMLQREQSRMRDPERTLVCDIIANCALLPDADGARYGTPNIQAETRPASGRSLQPIVGGKDKP